MKIAFYTIFEKGNRFRLDSMSKKTMLKVAWLNFLGGYNSVKKTHKNQFSWRVNDFHLLTSADSVSLQR